MKYLITGTSRGIGYAIAQTLLNEGHEVYGLSRTATLEHDHYHHYSIDLSDLKALPDQLQKITQAIPVLEGIICNAGQGKFGSLEEFSYAQIRHLIDMNFLSQAYLVKAFMPHLKKVQRGNILFIGSEAALKGGRSGSIYCASKFALRGFAQALREECAHDHIRVTLIHPGMVKSSFFDDLHFSPGEEVSEHIVPQDVADLALSVLTMREGTVVDEIVMSPQKKRVVFKKG